MVCSVFPSAQMSTRPGKVRLIDGKKTRVLLLDDHPLLTYGTAVLLDAQPDLNVLAGHTEVASLLQALKTIPCDVLVLDFHLPGEALGGVPLLRRLRSLYPDLALLVYSSDEGADTEYACWRAGANAVVSKRGEIQFLLDAIRQLRSSPDEFYALRDGELVAVSLQGRQELLSPSEVEVLRLLAQGLTVGQVAQDLFRSKQTISSHKHNAMHKLQLRDDLSLACYLKARFAH
jgi:two-component system capsular synthesis response regulator RcsB